MADTSTEPTTTTEVQAPVITFKKRKAAGRGKIRERPATLSPTHSDDDSSGYSENESDRKIKQKKKNTGGVTTSSTNPLDSHSKDLFTTVYTADRNTSLTDTNDATKHSNWYEENTKNAPAKSIGPTKAPSNVRTITTTDFAPDVCKDYKTTGFCGFGDNCKFLHAREDYKQGWQLDREWENVTKKKLNARNNQEGGTETGKAEGGSDEKGDASDNIPFACIICKESYKYPIVTRCGHYFCEACALKRYKREPTCAACGSATNGVFNSASQLQKLLDKKKKASDEG